MLRVGNQEKTGSIRLYMQSLFFFFNFLLCVGSLPVNNAAMVSGEETQPHGYTHAFTPRPPPVQAATQP